MNLPRTSRRSTAVWAINTATLAVLMASVWMSAQQRPAASPQISATPDRVEAPGRLPTAADLTTANHPPIGGAGTVAVGSTTVDADSLRRVAYNTTVKR